ncbi:MAG: tail fiber protein [Armatimonadetes bacterium]|nr:tail fiber protein [Armatimonadota bacterium]
MPSAALQEQIDDPDVKIDAGADLDVKIDALADDLTGVIVMWSGSIGSIPSGWALCDGTNGTPDLGDRFVLGTRPGTDPGQTGGSADHSHGIAEHTHKISPEGLHVHETNRQTRAVTAGSGTLALTVVTVRSGSGRHSHDTSSEVISTGAENHSPPYYRLAFIMRL